MLDGTGAVFIKVPIIGKEVWCIAARESECVQPHRFARGISESGVRFLADDGHVACVLSRARLNS
jgi:hypothetical protein